MGIILILRTAAISIVVALLAGGCSPRDEDGGEEMQSILVTTDILGDLVERIVPDVEVTVLVPPGTDAHEFEPSARQIAQLREADYAIANPEGYEEHLAEVFDDVEDLVHVQVEGGDPHWWMDPVVAYEVASDIAHELGTQMPSSLQRALEKADTKVARILHTVPPEDRKLVTDHDVLGRLAQRYGYEVVGAVVPSLSSQGSASAAQLADLATTMQAEGVDTVFVATGGSDRLARALTRELGAEAQVVRLPGESLGGHDHYEDMIVDLATRIAEALR